ncbi:hypothetical protein EIJ81_00225 (plasmid) [Aliivibrio salmonicida]|uniref:hypothetical protein n=1 Tax=Aliivibrio salmonicida TaxID=40269 RepID=UPI000F6D88CF|nr:hypothetical protein [Aliivibrio salmonicida]AZL83329.1 hypothetical protein EIJ81_00225 [Aliivibrio salmonicida]
MPNRSLVKESNNVMVMGHHDFMMTATQASLNIAEDLIMGGLANYNRTTRNEFVMTPTRVSNVSDENLINAFNHFVQALDVSVLKEEKRHNTILTDLERSGIESVSESSLILTQRFLKKRTHFVNSNTLLSAIDFATALGVQDKNTSRTLTRLRTKGEVLAIKLNDTYLYPSFQLNAEACVYPALIRAIPILLTQFTEWDIAFWLTTAYTITQSIDVLDLNDVEESLKTLKSLEDIALFVEKNISTDGTTTAVPLELLQKDEFELFELFVSDVCTDEPEVSLNVISLDLG